MNHKTKYLDYTHMTEVGSIYRLPPPGSYTSKQVCMHPYLSVHSSIAKIFNIPSFQWRILFQLAQQNSWIIQDKIPSKITSALPRGVHVCLLGYLYACSISWNSLLFWFLWTAISQIFGNSRLILKVLDNFLFSLFFSFQCVSLLTI